MSLAESEYTVLRHTIASRGTARITLLPVTLIGWALVAGTLAVLGNNPAMSLFPLVVLAGGFEAIHAMHVGVERIGRYLQVFYEGSADVPRWETTAMAIGPALPGGAGVCDNENDDMDSSGAHASSTGNPGMGNKFLGACHSSLPSLPPRWTFRAKTDARWPIVRIRAASGGGGRSSPRMPSVRVRFARTNT